MIFVVRFVQMAAGIVGVVIMIFVLIADRLQLYRKQHRHRHLGIILFEGQ